MTGSSCLFLLLTCCAGASPATGAPAEAPVVFVKAYESGSWHVQETEQFQVCVQSGFQEAEQIARLCEQLLTETRMSWLDDADSAATWRPKCQIILHPNKTSYLAAVGPGGGLTVGSALVERRQGQIISRRIDLCATARGGPLSSLPHEMTHIVLSDRFAAADPPRWADEGLAVMADPPDRKARHASELNQAIRGDALFRLPELLAQSGDACMARPALFYAQSTSLVDFLVTRGTRSQFLDFLTRADEEGYDAALRGEYAIDGVAGLEKLWHRQVASGDATPTVDSLVEDEAEAITTLKRS